MADQRWEEQMRQFWRKTGEDLRRTSEDIRTEAQKLLGTVLEPERQQRVREGLRDLGTWARRTADDIARRVEKAASQAEDAVQRAAQTVSERAANTPAAKVVERAVGNKKKSPRTARKSTTRQTKAPAGTSTGEVRSKKKKPAAKKKRSPKA